MTQQVDVLDAGGSQAPERPIRRSRFARHQKIIIVNGILCIVLTIVILQLWLLTATMNAYLGSDQQILLPAALVSLGCLLLNAGLLWYLNALDR